MDNLYHAHGACACPGHAWQDRGLSSLTGAALALYRGLDGVFCRLAGETGAVDHLFPSFLPAAMLSRLDYFQSFPHLATFATVLDSDEDNLDAFRKQNSLRADGSVGLTRIAPVGDVLTPAACYHFYRLYEGSNLDAPLYLTTLCSCHRRESHYVPLERQWNFSMREIVCIGSVDEVTAFLDHYRGRVAALCDLLDLPVAQAAASDPFFRPTQNPRWIAQRLAPLKTEFVFDGYLAASSVNFHRDYFGGTFAIRRGESPASSGCVAFGLERWMRMIIVRWGSDPAGWPDLTRLPS
jgi:hypothetical protein